MTARGQEPPIGSVWFQAPERHKLRMQNVVAAHKHSSNHRDEVMGSSVCGCFHCLATFAPSQINDWVDWPAGTPHDLRIAKGTTAMCPMCGIDSVIGSASNYPIERAFLTRMQQHWF